jgi:hypothetical protein
MFVFQSFAVKCCRTSQNDPAYLGRHSYQLINACWAIVGEGPVNDQTKCMLYSGQLRIRQKPGPKNALGLIKFDFSNHRACVYGTPSAGLFAKPRRDFSHSCIRVEDPVALAAWLLRDHAEWMTGRIRAAMLAERTFGITLEKPVPVLIVTAWRWSWKMRMSCSFAIFMDRMAPCNRLSLAAMTTMQGNKQDSFASYQWRTRPTST